MHVRILPDGTIITAEGYNTRLSGIGALPIGAQGSKTPGQATPAARPATPSLAAFASRAALTQTAAPVARTVVRPVRSDPAVLVGQSGGAAYTRQQEATAALVNYGNSVANRQTPNPSAPGVVSPDASTQPSPTPTATYINQQAANQAAAGPAAPSAGANPNIPSSPADLGFSTPAPLPTDASGGPVSAPAPDAAASSTGIYVGAGAAALALGIGLYVAFR